MLLIETIDNAFQLLSLGILAVMTVYRAVTTRNRIWILLYMFYIVIALGNLYWFLYMMLYKETPFYSFIPDFCWIAAIMALLLLLLYIREGEWKYRQLTAFWPVAVFTFVMSAFYMRYGKYLTNVLYAVFMAMLIMVTIVGFKNTEKGSGKRRLYLSSLLFCLVEYSLWTASCFDWSGPVFLDPYYFLDVLLTVSYILFYPAARKAVEDELH